MAEDTSDTPETKPAPKPRARRAPAKPAAPRAAKTAPAKAADKPAAKAPPKPRSSKRAATTRTAAKSTVGKAKKVAAKATDKVGGKWGAAAIAGGVVAAAGAAAALFTLRGSTPKDAKPQGKPTHGAKQADGTDSSKSFEAGIADEGSVPTA
ncbi:hypothetical protein [Sphingomonas sp.]|uniref:hypothetical protein n=1 Tax=Sphingomonas sp. TaxID=28214 RepID=UPI0035BC3C9F